MEGGKLFAAENGLLFNEISSTSQKDAPDLLEDIAFELYVSKVVPNLIPFQFQDNSHSTGDSRKETRLKIEDPYSMSKLIINKIIDKMFKCSCSPRACDCV